jgi:multimeric flavodoxin WrbA
MEIRILGISGSPRHGNTEILVKEALAGALEEGAETEYISFFGKKIQFCTGNCPKCGQYKNMCLFKDDHQDIFNRMKAADGIVMGSPVYLGNVTGQLKTFMDRCQAYEYNAKKMLLRLKVGGAIAVGAAPAGGQEFTLLAMHNFFHINDMISVGIVSPHTQWGATAQAYGIGDVRKHKWTMWSVPTHETSYLEMAKMLGKKVAKVAKIIKAGVRATGIDVPPPYMLDLSEEKYTPGMR